MIPLLLAACSAPPAGSDNVFADSGKAAGPPSFVLVLTDDQSHSLSVASPIIDTRLLADSVRFSQAVANTPLCAPTRASILSGGFHAHQTGVRTNQAPQGGLVAFDDSATLATAMKQAGWRTGYVGKYIDNLTDREDEVPPGWDRLVATAVDEDWEHFTAVVSEGGAPGSTVAVEQ